MTLLRARAIQKHYARAAKPTLAGVDLDVDTGEFVAVLGASGVGKTTLLHVLAGLLPSDEGTVEIAGEHPWSRREPERARFRRRTIGLLPQGAPLLDELDAVTNAALPLLLDGAPDADQRARTSLQALGVLDLAARRPRELSGGEALRVALARALVATPPLLLADEPTSHLDPDNARVAIAELRRARDRGCAVVAVTHDPEVAAAADQRLSLCDGRLR
ncbi:MAG TPA: ATP-binding cassette domain-containing protein [bacterium]|nr:ATP-binding cassette domain-containing protein [bacterium]